MNMKCAVFAGIIAAAALLTTAGPAYAGPDFCRGYSQQITTGSPFGSRQHGTMCLQPDGSWRVILGGGGDGRRDDHRQQFLPQRPFRYGAVSYYAPPPRVVYVYDTPRYGYASPGPWRHHDKRHDRDRDWRHDRDDNRDGHHRHR